MYQGPFYFKAKPIERVEKYNLMRGVAKKAGLSQKAKMRLEWIIFYYTAGGENATYTAKHFGISRSKFYFWFNRFNEKNLKSLEDRKSAPGSKRKWSPDPLVLKRMIRLRKKYTHYSKIKLSVMYRTIYGEEISSWQFQRVIQGFSLYPNKTNKRSYKKNGRKKMRITKEIRENANNLISIDTKVLYLFGVKFYIFMALTHDSKIAYARAYTTKASKNSKDFLTRLIFLLGYAPDVMLSDNGSEFASKAVRGWLRDLGVKTLFIEPGSPWENGYIESFNGKFRDELLNCEIFDTLTEAKVLVEMWRQEYNRFRPHSSLEYRPPAPETKSDLDPRAWNHAIYTSETVPKLS